MRQQIPGKSYKTAECHFNFFPAEQHSLLNNAVGSSGSAQCFHANQNHKN